MSLIEKKVVAKKIWREFQDSKFKEYYIDQLLARYKKLDLYSNIFLAIVTSGSVAAWGLWKLDCLKILWMSLVGTSQLLVLIKPYFNISKVSKELSDKYNYLVKENSRRKRIWEKLRFNQITPTKAYQQILDSEDALLTELKFSENVSINEIARYKDKALKKKRIYFENLMK